MADNEFSCLISFFLLLKFIPTKFRPIVSYYYVGDRVSRETRYVQSPFLCQRLLLMLSLNSKG